MYSDIVWEHFNSPRNEGELQNADVRGVAGTPGAGPFAVLTFAVIDGIITNAGFRTQGCAASIACCSYLTSALVGRAVKDYICWTVARLIDELEGLPPGKLHCPVLTIQALHDAFGSLGKSALPNGEE